MRSLWARVLPWLAHQPPPAPCDLPDGYVLDKARPDDLPCPHPRTRLVAAICFIHKNTHRTVCDRHEQAIRDGQATCHDCLLERGDRVPLKFAHSTPAPRRKEN
jgi:hypothetical protein